MRNNNKPPEAEAAQELKNELGRLQKEAGDYELSKAWKTISSTNAALRHLEIKLDVGPTSTAAFDPIMETKKAPISATRKISRKDGRYQDSSNAHISKASRTHKTGREKLSRSPLRATTLESNVKKTSHVAFREPLESYREASSAVSTANERSAVRVSSGLNVGGLEEKDFESTRSSAVDDTTVRYLNDRPAIEALEWRLPHSDVTGSAMHTDSSNIRLFDAPQQPPSFSPSNNRLETLKKRQPDAKLEKLKERIRRQWELSGEKDARDRIPSVAKYTEPVISAKTRKVACAPPPPVYPGFNPPKTKIRTPDGKLWQEGEFHNLSIQLQGNLLPPSQEISTTNDKSRMKRLPRPVRKVQRLGGAPGTGSPENKTGHIISTSSWRDGQKLVRQILGPGPKVDKESKDMSTERHENKVTSFVDGPLDRKPASRGREANKRPVSMERPKEKCPKSGDKQTVNRNSSKEKTGQDRSSTSASSSSHHGKSYRGPATSTKSQVSVTDHKSQVESSDVKKDFLPLEIRGILDDLQLDCAVDMAKPMRSRSHSPTKRKSDKAHVYEEPHISSKRRNYDTEQVRQYILRQQEERKKKLNEQREAQRHADEQKNKRLQELYQKQKEAFGKARSGGAGHREAPEPVPTQSMEPSYSRSQEIHPPLLLGQAWPEVTAQKNQVKPLYQPSGESDKENKGQERPPSASSSSDLSLSEPLQPLLRSDLMGSYCRQPDRLISKGPIPQSFNQPPAGTGILSQFLTLPKELESLLHSKKTSSAVVSETHRNGPQGKPASNFRSNLDRIETLKATAVSLSSRIESEARKLAAGPANLPLAWSTTSEPKQLVNIACTKPDSPPEREDGEDFFSARIQKMLGTCTSSFSQKDLPGANNLYAKLPEEFFPHAVASSEIREVRDEARRDVDMYANHRDLPNKASPSHNSSTSSISEGPIVSEGSLSDGEGLPSQSGSPFHPANVFQNKDFCIMDAVSYEPLTEFQKEASEYPPLVSSTISSNLKSPWEELNKGSPHSVINIFTKSYQRYGNDLDERPEESLQELQPLYAARSPQGSVSYADDFVSSPVSETDTPKVLQQSVDSSASSVKEELPLVDPKGDVVSSHSSGGRSAASSPRSSSSQRSSKARSGRQSDSPHQSLEHEHFSSDFEQKPQESKPSHMMSPPGREHSVSSDTDSTVGDLSSRSMASLLSDTGRTLRSPHSNAMDNAGQVPLQPGPSIPTALGSHAPGVVTGSGQGNVRLPPAVLHQRMSAELNYLSAMEESVRQLCDVERTRGISVAQQETVSLAQILKAQQQRHEQNMSALRQQAEQEAQASLRQLEEERQKSAQAQAEMLQHFQKTLDPSSPPKAHRIQEEIHHGRSSPANFEPSIISLTHQSKRTRPHGTRKKGSRSSSPSSLPSSSASSYRERPQSGSEHDSAPAPTMDTTATSELDESIPEDVPSLARSELEDVSQSIESKGTSSVGPVNEEGMEEQSFRSLLPSESHRRDSLERQRSHQHESDEESTPDKELSGPFSRGQNSFCRFTMEMVRQYMQEGEMRSTHQAALLRLRQKALKDKAKAELAWLEHQKRRLQDKGEDDKMPPLRKRQRGLLLRLQQEQAEIKRLQEANKAARRERQLILKQQEEIQRIQNSTLRFQEKLKSAESGQPELPSEGDIQPSPASTRVPSDAESRSPSPVSVSGSETSSIMQKLRKMHSHMDAKDICPVHCFFSVFTPQHWASLSVCFPKLHPKFQLYICRQLLRFLTKREQQLVQRRLHAQELLEWKRRLDAEEIEIRQIEKQALAAWDDKRGKTKGQNTEGLKNSTEEHRSIEGSPVQLNSTVHTETPVDYVRSESIEHSTITEQIQEPAGDHSSISEELGASFQSKPSPQDRSKSHESGKSSTKSVLQQVHITLRPHQTSQSFSEDSLSVPHSETTSDQSDIECRVRALKDELRKRKSVVENLKREQKRRQKERLKAQEAILLKQLQSYDDYIRKTQAELSGDQGAAPTEKLVAAVESKEQTNVISNSAPRFDGASTCKAANEKEGQMELSTKSNGSSSQQRSQSSRKEIETESFLEQIGQSFDPSSPKENISRAYEPHSPLSPLRDTVSCSTHSSPVSSIQSDIAEEMLETGSHFSASPPPALSLNLRSPTSEESLSPNRDKSYSDDFEASAPMKHSASETPREEIEVSYATTPGRDLPSEGLAEHEEEYSECRSLSPQLLNLLELTPAVQDPVVSYDITDPLVDFQLGDRVLVSGVQPGTLRFKGETHFAEGIWAGVELDKSEGNNDGAHGGRRYFSCLYQHGIFAPPHKISHLVEDQTDGYGISVEQVKDEIDAPRFNETLDNKVLQTTSESEESSISEAHHTSQEEPFLTRDSEVRISTTDELNRTQQSFLYGLDKETVEGEKPELNTLSESLVNICLKDTVTFLQNIRRERAEKIQQSNLDVLRSPITNELYSYSDDIRNEDVQPQTVPVFDALDVQDDLAELEPGHNLLTVLGEEPDWFDEDFGLSSHKAQKLDLEKGTSVELTPEPCFIVPLPEPAPKPMLPVPQPEPLMAVPHTASEVEQLVQMATEQLWRWKHLGGDLQEIRTSYTKIGEDDPDSAGCAYKAVVFDLTLQIFHEICSPDPRGSQPPWKKPPRVSPLYARRVKDPHSLQDVKSFLTDEVLSLLSLKKAQNHKTDWQRMMKFGRKKRDRVDHILVQELHEEEAQWVNYDEDELFVKMQLADGIFEALIRDTVQVLQHIQEKKNLSLLV
ncbi:LOW QUALITY PROTEIN: centrosome-associated protein 350 [Pelodytes ibericus]